MLSSRLQMHSTTTLVICMQISSHMGLLGSDTNKQCNKQLASELPSSLASMREDARSHTETGYFSSSSVYAVLSTGEWAGNWPTQHAVFMARQLGMHCMAGNGAPADCHEQAGKDRQTPLAPPRPCPHTCTLYHTSFHKQRGLSSTQCPRHHD